eukprot:7800479-Pyramimonas_sp.AAC.1
MLASFQARFANAPAASVFPSAFPVRSSCTSGSTAPALTTDTLLPSFQARCLNAPAAVVFPAAFPVRSSCTSGSTAPAPAM